MAAQIVTPTYTWPVIETDVPAGAFVVHLSCTSATGGAIAYDLVSDVMEFLAPVAPESTSARRSKFYLYQVMTDPGSTAPTAGWDLTITDAGLGTQDVMGGACLDRDTSTTEWAVPAGGAPVPVCGQISIAVANAGDAKTLSIHMFFSCYR